MGPSRAPGGGRPDGLLHAGGEGRRGRDGRDPEAVAAGIQTDLDAQGIAKNARQEKLAARAAAREANGNGAARGANGTNGTNGKSEKDAAYDQQMAALYRQHVLKEEAPPIVQIQGLKSSKQDDLVGVG